jgi:hypothetical protein
MSHTAAVALLLLPALACVVAGSKMLEHAMRRPVLLIEDLALALAWVFPLGSLVWLEAYLTRSTLFGFDAPWTWLTAAHFGAAGFGALTISAWLVRTVPGQRPRRVLQGLLFVHPVVFGCVAAGITGAPYLDEIGATVYAAIFIVQATVYVLAAQPRGPLRARLLLGVALWVPVCTMVPAVAWAWGRPVWNLDEMIVGHGLVNAIGHVGVGLLALAWLRPPRRVERLRAPLSRLASRGRVDPAFLDDRRLPDAATPSGLSDDLRRYARDDLDVSGIHPDVIAFYEDTRAFELDLDGRWHVPFRAAGWVWTRFVAPALGQLGLPGPGRRIEGVELSSRIVDVDDRRDGRENVRGWIRTWRSTKRTLYVAAYAEHVTRGVRYMNIAFALPGANLTSILHLTPVGRGALALTSRHHQHFGGDQGVYLVRGKKPWRLPLDETIWVFPASEPPDDIEPEPDAVLVARHVMWCFGLRYATLTYQIRRHGSRRPIEELPTPAPMAERGDRCGRRWRSATSIRGGRSGSGPASAASTKAAASRWRGL